LIIEVMLCIDVHEDIATRWVNMLSIFTNFCHLLDMIMKRSDKAVMYSISKAAEPSKRVVVR
jgi:hypothetical protein